MIRVTSGIAKGRRLELPKNKKVTAVKEVVKLAIFSILGDKVEGATCLDLFAGSGNLGIEALSRGATFCQFVDESRESLETIEKNLKTTHLNENSDAIRDDVIKYLGNTQSTYDIIFADPYYADTTKRYLLKLCIEKLNPNGMFFLLSSSGNGTKEIPKELKEHVLVDSRKYGKTFLAILSKIE